MGRADGKKPKQERSQETVEAIFGAVTRLLQTKKIEDLVGSEVCRVAGVSPGSLYQYFKNVDDLVGAWESREIIRNLARLTTAIQEMNDEGAAARKAGLPPPKSLADNVRTLAMLGLTILREYLAHYRAPEDSRLLRRVQDRTETIRTCARFLASALVAHPRPEEVNLENVELASVVAVTAVTMCAYETSQRDEDMRAYDAEVANMIARFLCRVPPT